MTTEIQNQEPHSEVELDAEAALSEISADLFGQGGESGEAETGRAPATSPAVETDPSLPTEAAKTEEETSTEVQEVGAPKTWSKDALAEWATIPPRAQQEILKREEDALKGITMYKQRAELGDQYDKVVEPYKPLLTAANIDPVQMFQSFAANHYILSRGTDQQKLELAANMLSGYQIDFAKLASHIGDQLLEPADPRLAALEQEIASLKAGQTSRQQQEQTATVERLGQEIETFAADPAHPYFTELADDIAKLFEAGQAATLQEAYEKAVYLNPTTRQKEIDRLTAEKATSLTADDQARKDKIAKSTAADLNINPKSRNGTVPLGSVDDTLSETMARIQARG